MVKALITGATGCVGANLVEAVTQHGWEARALRRKTSSLQALDGLTYEVAFGDIMQADTLIEAMRGIDIVFHAAAVADYWRTGKERLYTVNVEGTRNVLQAAKICGISRVVFTSSVAALGLPEFGRQLDETDQFNMRPEQFHYGYSKMLAEQVVAEFVSSGLDVVIVNPAVVIGPRDINRISGSILLEEKHIGLPVYPPGGVCVIDVADVCNAEISAVEHGRRGERYILGGENLWYRDLITATAQVVGQKPPRVGLSRGATRAIAIIVDLLRHAGARLPATGDQVRFSAETLWFDSGKARRELGLNTRPYRETAQRSYEWYRRNGFV
jgi:dihydroflavonol-4-reductase